MFGLVVFFLGVLFCRVLWCWKRVLLSDDSVTLFVCFVLVGWFVLGTVEGASVFLFFFLGVGYKKKQKQWWW